MLENATHAQRGVNFAIIMNDIIINLDMKQIAQKLLTSNDMSLSLLPV